MANGYQASRVVKQTTHNGPLGGEPPMENGVRSGEWGGAVRSGEAMRTAEQVRLNFSSTSDEVVHAELRKRNSSDLMHHIPGHVHC